MRNLFANALRSFKKAIGGLFVVHGNEAVGTCRPVLLVQPPIEVTAIEEMRTSANARRTSRAMQLFTEVVISPAGSLERKQALEALHSFKKAAKRSWDAIGLVMPQNILDELQEITHANAKKAKKLKAITVKSRAMYHWQGVLKGSKADAISLLQIKKSSRRGWEALGLSEKAGLHARLLLSNDPV